MLLHLLPSQYGILASNATRDYISRFPMEETSYGLDHRTNSHSHGA
jgi:hypothetical protein